MGMYETVFDRCLTRIDPEVAHERAAVLLQLAGSAPMAAALRAVLRPAQRGSVLFDRPVTSPVGIAAGFDKNARMVRGLAALGFGFVEVGTVTAHAQPGNDKPRLFRIPSERALHNRMGFNNDGARVVASRLARLRRTAGGKKVVLGVNIGKSKVTPSDEAVADYQFSAKLLAPYADYLVVNVSSPNTPGLRDLQAVTSLSPILTGVQRVANHAAARAVPVLVKIAPDLADDDIHAVARLVTQEQLAGVVAVNTTIAHAHGAGGVSGPLLKPRGLEVVRELRGALGPTKVIIGVGGISTPVDATDYLRAGASAVQAYTGFIYGGPTWPARISRQALRS